MKYPGKVLVSKYTTYAYDFSHNHMNHGNKSYRLEMAVIARDNKLIKYEQKGVPQRFEVR